MTFAYRIPHDFRRMMTFTCTACMTLAFYVGNTLVLSWFNDYDSEGSLYILYITSFVADLYASTYR